MTRQPGTGSTDLARFGRAATLGHGHAVTLVGAIGGAQSSFASSRWPRACLSPALSAELLRIDPVPLQPTLHLHPSFTHLKRDLGDVALMPPEMAQELLAQA